MEDEAEFVRKCCCLFNVNRKKTLKLEVKFRSDRQGPGTAVVSGIYFMNRPIFRPLSKRLSSRQAG